MNKKLVWAFAFVYAMGLEVNPLIATADVIDKTLSNRMKVVVIEDRSGPAVFIRVLLPHGQNDDPPGKAGVSELTAELVQKGAGNRDAEQMAELVDWLGASLVGYSDAEYTVIGADVLAAHLETGLELVRDMVLAPRLDKREFSLLKDQAVAEIKAKRSNPPYLASILMPPAVFGPKLPQGNVKTEDGLEKITVEDARQFHKTILQASDAIVLVIGDVNGAEVMGKLEAAFGKIPSGTPVKLPLEIPSNLAAGRVLEAPKEELTQTTVLIGKPGPGRISPDYYSTLVANYVLGGGGFVCRLMDALRSKGGKTYGVRSAIVSTATPDLFTIKFTTRNEEVVDSLKLTLDVMRRFVEEGPTDTEVSEAKEFFKGYFFLQTETPAQRASKILTYIFYGLGMDELERYPSRVESVTRHSAHESARRYLTPDNLTISFCGPASVISAAKSSLSANRKK